MMNRKFMRKICKHRTKCHSLCSLVRLLSRFVRARSCTRIQLQLLMNYWYSPAATKHCFQPNHSILHWTQIQRIVCAVHIFLFNFFFGSSESNYLSFSFVVRLFFFLFFVFVSINVVVLCYVLALCVFVYDDTASRAAIVWFVIYFKIHGSMQA